MTGTWHRPASVLAAVDFDTTAEAVLSRAQAWARQLGATLSVLHVSADDSADGLREAARELRALVEAAEPAGASRPDAIVRAGRPGEVIATAAAAMEAGLIVVGTHGRGVVGRRVLGSVAGDLLRTTDLPVLLVQTPDGFDHGRTVIAAVDLSEASDAVVLGAGELAAESAAPLRILHVFPIGDHRSPGHRVLQQGAMRALRELQAQYAPAGLETTCHVAMQAESVAAAIAHDAAHSGAALLVMGGHGASGWIAGTLGGVTERVLHETTCPVLVLRPRPSGGESG